MKEQEKCHKCRNYHQLTAEGSIGECRCNPPTIGVSGKAMFPIVNSDMNCGSFDPIADSVVSEQTTNKRQLLKG